MLCIYTMNKIDTYFNWFFCIRYELGVINKELLALAQVKWQVRTCALTSHSDKINHHRDAADNSDHLLFV